MKIKKTGPGILIMLFVIYMPSFSQDYVDRIAQKSCECLEVIPDTLDRDQFNTHLGLCMIEAAQPYKKRLKKDYKIDLDKIDVYAGELGRMIGMRMASVCPASLVKLTQQGKSNRKKDNTEEVFEGQIIHIEEGPFVIFSIKDQEGKILKFYWLTFIESNIELSTGYRSLIRESVRVTFRPQEFFDPRINEYKNFYVIQTLQVLPE